MEYEIKKDLYKREKYLNKIRGFYHETEIIKVLTGVRRCGKSSIMNLIAGELIENGVKAENILYFNLDKKPYDTVSTTDALDKLIADNNTAKGIKYLFIDEIQNVKGFERVINSWREEGDFSIFITGSNSYLLSGELVTKLTGRYIEFNILPLTFDEYLEIKKFFGKQLSPDDMTELRNYILEPFFGFCNELHISKSSHLIRLSNEGVKVLNQLRTRGRAYAYFINLIYLKTKIKLNECCKNKFNVDSLELSSQKRIESLFKSSLRKTKSSKEKNENCLKTDISSSNKTLKKREHPISYAEIKRDALLAFKDLKISDSIIEKCVAYILNSYTVSGKSCIQTYDEKSVQVKAIYKKASAPVSPKAEVPNTEPPKIYIQLNGSSQSYQ